MNTKTSTIIILLICVVMSSCTQAESVADSFIEYDSSEFIAENQDLPRPIPVFSLKYPPDWDHGWVGDSGIISLMVSSGDYKDAFFGRDTSSAIMMVIPIEYSGEKLADLFFTKLNAGRTIEQSRSAFINGQEAAIAEYTDEENLVIEAVIVRGEWALLIFVQFPNEEEEEFRPFMEAMIDTIEIQ